MSENQKIEAHVTQRYEVLKKLGSGAYGHVFKVKSKESGLCYAMKKIFEAFQHATDAQRTFRQISVLKKIQHRNIVRLHEVIDSKSGRDVYLIFEFMQTDLCNAIYEGILQKVHEKYIIYQMLLSLAYLHSAQIIHRDLKPSNVLLKGDCSAKLCDFGLVRFIGKQNLFTNILTEGVATRWYRAPQVLLGSNSYDERADLWSLGCIIAEIVIRNPIFPGNSTIEQLEKVLQFTGRPSVKDIESIKCELAEPMINNIQIKAKNKKEYFSPNIDTECISLIISLVEFNPNKRLSALEALKHPYLKEFYDPKDIKLFTGKIQLQVNDNVQLSTQQYKNLIVKHFVGGKQGLPRRLSSQKLGMGMGTPSKAKTTNQENESQPRKFSDLKRKEDSREKDGSFSSLLTGDTTDSSSRNKPRNFRSNVSNSKQKSQLNLFEELIKGKSSSKNKHKESSTIAHPTESFNSFTNGGGSNSSHIKQKERDHQREREHRQRGNSNGSNHGVVFRKTSKSREKENISSNTKELYQGNTGKLLEKYERKQPLISAGDQGKFKGSQLQNYQMGSNATNSGQMKSFLGLRKVSKMNR